MFVFCVFFLADLSDYTRRLSGSHRVLSEYSSHSSLHTHSTQREGHTGILRETSCSSDSISFADEGAEQKVVLSRQDTNKVNIQSKTLKCLIYNTNMNLAAFTLM